MLKAGDTYTSVRIASDETVKKIIIKQNREKSLTKGVPYGNIIKLQNVRRDCL